jgi:hypothetical protein
MIKYHKLLLSIEEINISKDCIRIICEYLVFDIKHIDSIRNILIKSSKYFEDFNFILRENIDKLLDYNTGYFKNFNLNNENLIIFDNDTFYICSNNILITLITRSVRKTYVFTYSNNNIYFGSLFNDKIQVINTENRCEKFWSLNGENKDYKGCLSINSYDNKIYAIVYNEKKSCDNDINIYSENGELLKSSKILMDDKKFSPFQFSMTIHDKLIYVCYNKRIGSIESDDYGIGLQIYDINVNLLFDKFNILNQTSFGNLRGRIIVTKSKMIMAHHLNFNIYDYM